MRLCLKEWSESSGNGPETLAGLVAQGRLDAALTTLPIPQEGLRMKTVCSEAMQVCLRLDDPLANEQILTKDEVQERLTVFFSRDAHPLFHDDLLGRFRHFGIELRPSSFVLSTSQMQSVVKANGELGLLPETTPIDAELTLRPIQGVNVRMKTGFIWSPEQQNPSFPLVIYRLVELCPHDAFRLAAKKKPPVSVGLDGAVRSERSA